MIGNSDTEANFPHKLDKLDKSQSLRKVFANHTLADIKLSKAQLTKTQKGGNFLKKIIFLSKTEKIEHHN